MIADFFLTNWFLEGMRFLYANLDSVFYTILVSTIILKIITLPTDIKTRQYSAKMAAIQPDLQRLQKKYQNDPSRVNREQQKLMKERGVSMWGSCLPLLISMPLFFCFIAAFRFWGYEMTIRLLTASSTAEGEQLFRSFKFLWINNIWQPDNGLKPVIESASSFLSTKNVGHLLFLKDNPEIGQKLIDMGLAVRSTTKGLFTGETACYEMLNTDAAKAAFTAAMQPYADMYAGYNNGWFLMPLIAGASNFFSVWLTQRNQPTNQADGSTKLMSYIFPIMTVFICMTSSSAFAIYWTLSSVLMIITNFILDKKYPRAAALAPEEDNKK